MSLCLPVCVDGTSKFICRDELFAYPFSSSGNFIMARKKTKINMLPNMKKGYLRVCFLCGGVGKGVPLLAKRCTIKGAKRRENRTASCRHSRQATTDDISIAHCWLRAPRHAPAGPDSENDLLLSEITRQIQAGYSAVFKTVVIVAAASSFQKQLSFGQLPSSKYHHPGRTTW
jgi:hypothetical protein